MTAHPHVPMRALDTLWFQVAGTLCNIECTHCFVSSSPTNRSHGMLALQNLAEVKINPVVTVTETAEGVRGDEGRARFLDLIRSFGFTKPRLKVLPLFRLGAEEKRTHAYEDWERIRVDELSEADAE